MPRPLALRRLVLLTFLCTALVWLLLGPGDAPPTSTSHPDQESPAPAATPPRTESPLRQPMPAVTPPVQAAGAPAPQTPGPAGATRAAQRAADHHGQVREIDGPPTPGIVVVLRDRAGEEIARSVTDDRGRFTFEQPPTANARVETLGIDGAGPHLRHRARWSNPPLAVTLWIPPPGEIAGTVVDAAGRPVAGIRVATDRGAAPLLNSPFEFIGKAPTMFGPSPRTGTDGRFRIAFARHGTHHLRALDDAHLTVATTTAAAGDREAVLRIGAEDPDTHDLSGVVTDASNDSPLAGVRLFVQRIERIPGGYSAHGITQATTDPSGSYVATGLRPGTYCVVHRTGQHTPYTSPELTIDGEDARHDLSLWPTRSLTVRVLRADGGPASRAWITAWSTDGELLAQRHQRIAGLEVDSVRTNAKGQARLRGLPATAIEIRAINHDLLPAAHQTVDLTEAREGEFILRLPVALPRGARGHFLVLRDEANRPIEVPRDGEVLAEVWADGRLVSSVTGRWTTDGFTHGHGLQSSHEFDDPTLSVLLPPPPSEVRLKAPGYYDAAVQISPDAESPTIVTLRR